MEEEEERSQQSGELENNYKTTTHDFERRSPGAVSPMQRWEKQMNDHTEKSMRDSQKNFRQCCSMQAEAFIRGNKSFLSTSMTQKEFMNIDPYSNNNAIRTLNRGKSAGISRATMNQKKLNKNFHNLASNTNLGAESTNATTAM